MLYYLYSDYVGENNMILIYDNTDSESDLKLEGPLLILK